MGTEGVGLTVRKWGQKKDRGQMGLGCDCQNVWQLVRNGVKRGFGQGKGEPKEKTNHPILQMQHSA